jgi:hypothetical protein
MLYCKIIKLVARLGFCYVFIVPFVYQELVKD